MAIGNTMVEMAGNIVCGLDHNNDRTDHIPLHQWQNSGTSYAKFTVAANDGYRDKETQEWKETNTVFMNVLVTGPLAAYVANRYRKGTPVRLKGALQARVVGEEGSRRTFYEIRAEYVDVDSKRAASQAMQQAQQAQQQPAPQQAPAPQQQAPAPQAQPAAAQPAQQAPAPQAQPAQGQPAQQWTPQNGGFVPDTNPF